MKALILAAILSGSVSAMAIETVNGADHSCADLQSMVKEQGKLYVEGYFGSGLYYGEYPSCGTGGRKSIVARGFDQSADVQWCNIGWTCRVGGNNK